MIWVALNLSCAQCQRALAPVLIIGHNCIAVKWRLTPKPLPASFPLISAALQRGEEEDSHELLRLLLDGLEREELRARSAPEARTVPACLGRHTEEQRIAR